MQLPPQLVPTTALEITTSLSNDVASPVSSPQSKPLSSQHSRLSLSGYDPRAVGGRQTVRLSLPNDFAKGLDNLELRVRCDLLPLKTSQYRFVRALSGEWQSILLSFSSRNKEHGQYPLEMEVRFHHEQQCLQRWLCSSVLLLPRSDASLSEIHQVFLASQKNVRVIAEDGAIARLQHDALGLQQHRHLNLEVIARDASLAQVVMPSSQSTQQETAPGYLAWDEVLVEVAPEALTQEQAIQSDFQQRRQAAKPVATQTTECVSAQPRAYYHPIRHHWLRILEGQHWRIGRAMLKHETTNGHTVDIHIAHPRISAVHAVIQHRGEHIELIDCSRYGILLNGERLSPMQAMRLKVGDVIDLCASFAGQLRWQVISLDQQMIVLQHSSDHGAFETLCLLYQADSEKPRHRHSITNQLLALQSNTDVRGLPPFSPQSSIEADNTVPLGWQCFTEPYPNMV